tara:strand:+ start:58 stop:237 length:180 start_codon:yes stop_codon:yes gene_type:complete
MINQDKIDHLATLETELNNALWHLQVCEENKAEVCRLVIGRHIRAAKVAFDKHDNEEWR